MTTFLIVVACVGGVILYVFLHMQLDLILKNQERLLVEIRTLHKALVTEPALAALTERLTKATDPLKAAVESAPHQ